MLRKEVNILLLRLPLLLNLKLKETNGLKDLINNLHHKLRVTMNEKDINSQNSTKKYLKNSEENRIDSIKH